MGRIRHNYGDFYICVAADSVFSPKRFRLKSAEFVSDLLRERRIRVRKSECNHQNKRVY